MDCAVSAGRECSLHEPWLRKVYRAVGGGTVNWTIFGVWELIFCSGCLVGSAGFLVSTSRKRSSRREPFRRGVFLLGLGAAVLSAAAVIVVLDGQTAGSETMNKAANWLLVPVLLVVASGLFLLWMGHRAALRAAGTYPPGKHASPAMQAKSRRHG
jgi:cytochrome bd-type quinol oxidase subunit 2